MLSIPLHMLQVLPFFIAGCSYKLITYVVFLGVMFTFSQRTLCFYQMHADIVGHLRTIFYMTIIRVCCIWFWTLQLCMNQWKYVSKVQQLGQSSLLVMYASNVLCVLLVWHLIRAPSCNVWFLFCLFIAFYFYVFLVQFAFPTEPGVPYDISVRPITAAGKGKPVVITVFSVQQGNVDLMTIWSQLNGLRYAEYVYAIVMRKCWRWLCMYSNQCPHLVSPTIFFTFTGIYFTVCAGYHRATVFLVWHAFNGCC